MSERYKIAMVAACPFPYPRGTPVRIFRMAEALSQKGHQVHVVTYHIGDQANEAPFTIHRIPAVKSYRRYAPGPSFQKLAVLDPLLLRELLRVLKRNDFDLIHAHHYEGLILSWWARKWTNLPVVYDAHTLLESELPYYYQPMLPGAVKRKVGHWLDRLLPRTATHTVAATDEIRDKQLQIGSIGPENITVVGNGVELDHFNTTHNGHETANGTNKTLVYAGNFASYQRIDLLLKIFSEVLREREDVRLRLISNSSFDTYQPLAYQLGVLERIDVVKAEFDSLPHYLGEADLALNPRTHCDGMPQKLLNYMAAGKPIVSFEGSAKILKHGETGLIVQNDDSSAFSQAVVRLLGDSGLATSLGANARKQITTERTWAKTAECLEAVYHNVLNPA